AAEILRRMSRRSPLGRMRLHGLWTCISPSERGLLMPASDVGCPWFTARSDMQRARSSDALRACSDALLAGPKPALASCSQVAAGGHRWLLLAVRGISGTR